LPHTWYPKHQRLIGTLCAYSCFCRTEVGIQKTIIGAQETLEALVPILASSKFLWMAVSIGPLSGDQTNWHSEMGSFKLTLRGD
jgi:hypothetical protein